MTPTTLVFGLYVLVVGAIALYTRHHSSNKDFLYASHDLSATQTECSLFASFTSSYNIVIIVALSVVLGPYLLLAFLGLVGGYAALYFLVAKPHHEHAVSGRFVSIVDYVAFRRGKLAGWSFNLLTLFVLVVFMTFQVHVNAAVFSSLLGVSLLAAALLTSGIVLAYILIGGLRTSVTTDVFQGMMMLLIIGLLLFTGIAGVAEGSVWQRLSHGQALVGSLAIAVTQFFSILVQPELWQRVYAARSLLDLRRGMALSVSLLLALWIPLILIGLNAAGVSGGAAADFMAILKTSAPAWFVPILAISLFAAFMSTLDSSLNAFSSQLAKSVLSWPETSDETLSRRTRAVMVVALCPIIPLALYLPDILTAVFQLISVTIIPGLILLAAHIKWFTKGELITGMAVGVLIFLWMAFSGVISQNPVTSLYPGLATALVLAAQRGVVALWWRFR